MIARRDTIVFAAATALTSTAGAQTPAQTSPTPTSTLEQVAQYEMQGTGVACSRDGRIFICFPRWEQDVPVSVAELRNGQLIPYPNTEWNAWRNAQPLSAKDHFVCVQSVTVDPQGFLWILDPAAPGLEFIIPDGPKMLKVDLRTNQIVQAIHFGTDAAPQGSYLNDVRVSPDGRWAYLTDSGATGALVVVDLHAGRPMRLLAGDPSTQAESGVKVAVNGRELRRPDGRGVKFSADSLALTTDGKALYWQALTGHTLYAADTASLQGGQPKVRAVSSTMVADGYWIARDGRFYTTSPEDNSVKLRRPDHSLQNVVQDERLLWPDSMAEMADGSLLVTASDIQDMAMWHDKGSTRTQPYRLFRFKPPPKS